MKERLLLGGGGGGGGGSFEPIQPPLHMPMSTAGPSMWGRGGGGVDGV